MTFVIAQITDEDGELSLIADTKLMVEHDDRGTRQIYTRPCQKVAILDDDVVAGFAGDTPETSLRHLAGLRGMPIDKIVRPVAITTVRQTANPDSSRVSAFRRAPVERAAIPPAPGQVSLLISDRCPPEVHVPHEIRCAYSDQKT